MIKLSACVIVKNEEKNIRQWLQCMKQVADELIVVDTGSTDATKEIVRQSSAQLYDFLWQQDFAAAKNFALSKAHGSWIAFLDADEYFSDASIVKLPGLLQRLHPQVEIVGIMCRLVNIDLQDRNRFIGATTQLRLFRNLSTLRYRGKVHEALDVPKNRMIELVKDIEIIHTGYSACVVQGKLRRNLELLQQKIAVNGGKTTPRDCRYLMDCYYGLADYPKAIEYAERALVQLAQMKDARMHLHIIRVSAYLFGKFDQQIVLQSMDEAIGACPDVADFLMMKGLYLFEQQVYVESEACLRQALVVREKYQLDVEGVADNLQRFLPSAYWVLGQLADLQHEADQAREYYLQALKVYPYQTGALQQLVKSLERANVPAVGIIELLQAVYSETDADYLATALRKQGGDVFLYYAARAKEVLPVYEYLAAGRYEAAAAASAENLTWLYQCGICDALECEIPPEGTLQLLLPPAYQKIWQALWQGHEKKTTGAQAILRMREQWRKQIHETEP